MKKKRIINVQNENFQYRSDFIRPVMAARIFSHSVDFFYNHWQEMGGKVVKLSRKANYYPIPIIQLEEFFGLRKTLKFDYLMCLSPDEKKVIAIELLPYIREYLFNDILPKNKSNGKLPGDKNV